METMHASGRRNLPPVPRPAGGAIQDSAVPDEPAVESPAESPLESPVESPAESTVESPAERTVELRRRNSEETTSGDAPVDDTVTAEPAIDLIPDLSVDPAVLAAADEPELALEDDDPAQDFVSRLRAAASEFAAAAGAASAVVREAVPPARHRRSRCRVVLRYPDGDEADLTFLGAVGRPGTPAWEGFDQQIQHWLGTGQQRQDAWLVEDPEAQDGIAVDVPAWLAAV
jgi:hypothetical protein